MNLLFIVNPTAGQGKKSALNAIEPIKEFCMEKNINYEIVTTAYRGHATTLARQSYSSQTKYDAVISVGGDGTLLEVANGLIGSDTLLGILPAGRGNDFVRTLGVTPVLKKALGFLTEKNKRLIDVGGFHDNYFINVASIGFDAEVARDVLRYKRFLPGRFSYFLVAILKFFTFKFKEVTIEIDEEKINTRIVLVAIANGKYYGGGMKVNPNGRLDDGYLNVIVVHSIPRYKFPFLLSKFMKGAYENLPYVKTYKCRKISINCEEKLVINADGEILGSTPVTFNVRPSSLNVIGG